MMDLSHLGPFAFYAAETYASGMPFDRLVGLVKYVFAEKGINGFDEVLVIELPEGIFLKSANRDLCAFLADESGQTQKNYPIEPINRTRFDDLTRKYRSPLRSFGNERLARWKLGF